MEVVANTMHVADSCASCSSLMDEEVDRCTVVVAVLERLAGTMDDAILGAAAVDADAVCIDQHRVPLSSVPVDRFHVHRHLSLIVSVDV